MNQKKSRLDFKVFQDVIFFTSKSNKYRFIFTIFISVVTGIMEIQILTNLSNAFLIINKKISPISQVIKSYCLTNNLDFCITDKDSNLFYIVFFLFLILTTFILRMISIYSLTKTAALLTSELGKKVFSTIIRREYSYHVNNNTSTVIGLCVNDIAVTSEGIKQFMLLINNLILSFFIVIGVIINGNKYIYFILLFITLFYSIFIFFTKSKLRVFGLTLTNNRYEVIRRIQKSIGNILNIILYRSHIIHINQYNFFNSILREVEAKQLFLKLIPRVVIETLIIFFIGILALVVIISPNNYIDSEILSSLGVLAVATQRLVQYLQQSLLNWSSVIVGTASTRNLLNILRYDQYLYLSNNKKEKFNNLENDFKFESLECKNITYFHHFKKDIEKNGVKNISLKINRNENIGIIGKTGSGKSTLFNLLMALLFPQNGILKINQKQINNFYNDELLIKYQKSISYVPQKIYLFDGTILENITLKQNEELINSKILKKVIEITLLNDVIKSLPKGLKSIVGENGMKLSGGQQQRIGIARALYNSKFEILFLDEATSALDTSTEKKLIDNLINYFQDKTIVMIAHRHKTLEKCSRIIKIENNSIIYDGESKKILDK